MAQKRALYDMPMPHGHLSVEP